MTKKSQKEVDQPESQLDKFKATAKKLGAEGNEKIFDKALLKIAYSKTKSK